jgi:hypothetical protein
MLSWDTIKHPSDPTRKLYIVAQGVACQYRIMQGDNDGYQVYVLDVTIDTNDDYAVWGKAVPLGPPFVTWDSAKAHANKAEDAYAVLMKAYETE